MSQGSTGGVSYCLYGFYANTDFVYQ